MNSILLVGRTNAGKSSIFNALIGKSISVVDSTENLTNDIIKFSCDEFTIYDSPGFEKIDEFEKFLQRVKNYDTVCIICDPNDYSYSLCKSILSYFKNKTCILVINKSDLIRDHREFGFGKIEVFKVSVLNRNNIDKLRQRLSIPTLIKQSPGNNSASYSIFGRANVGKSSLANSLLGFERYTVLNKVGTTKEINPEYENNLGITLVDTPGYRKNNSMLELDKASQYRLENYIKKSDQKHAIFVIDAQEGFLRTDRLIIDKILDKFTLFFVISKVDVADQLIIKEIESEIRRMYPNLEYVLFSAIQNVGTKDIIKLINKYKNIKCEIATSALNKWLHSQENYQVKYATQKNWNTFILFAKKKLRQSQVKYLENSFCKYFNIQGRRIKFEFRVN